MTTIRFDAKRLAKNGEAKKGETVAKDSRAVRVEIAGSYRALTSQKLYRKIWAKRTPVSE